MPEIGLSRISLSGMNPRKSFDPEAFEELKKSIKEHGILEPLIVRVKSQDPEESYELVAGERRFRAAQELELEEVPVVIKQLSDRAVREIMLIENLQRSQLEPLEEAAALEALLQDDKITQEELGKKLGKSQAWIANRLRLFQAPEELKQMVISREISPKHVMALLPVIEYPVYKESILPVVNRETKTVGEISVKRLEGLIEQCIINDHSGDYVFRLDELGRQYRELKKYLDMPGCAKNCPHVRRYNRYGGTVRYCLNRRCFSDKMNVAKQKFEKANAVHLKKLGDKKTVDAIKLGYGKYNYLCPSDFDNGFDEVECVACESCKKNKTDLKQLVCIDVACYKKKERAQTKEKNKEAREENEKVFVALDELLLDIRALGEKELRFLALRLGENIIWSQAVKKALKPWEHLVKGDAKLPAIKDVPAEDLPKLLLRFVIIQRMNGGNGTAAMEQFISATEGLGA